MKQKTTFIAVLAILLVLGTTALAAEKPNIVVIMGDDIGMWNIGAYHRGMMAGTTPNIDKLAAEGAIFTDYYAEASCTAGGFVLMADIWMEQRIVTIDLLGDEFLEAVNTGDPVKIHEDGTVEIG